MVLFASRDRSEKLTSPARLAGRRIAVRPRTPHWDRAQKLRELHPRLQVEEVPDDVGDDDLLDTLEPLEQAALDAAGQTVLQLGIEVEAFGENAVMVRAVPALLIGRDPADLVRSLAQELNDPDASPQNPGDRSRLLAAADRVFATLACHSARRFGDHLEAGEQRAILSALDEIPWAPTCPHGRPVAPPAAGEIDEF